jgi:hypothetical protein
MIGNCMWVGCFNKIKNIPNFQAYEVLPKGILQPQVLGVFQTFME